MTAPKGRTYDCTVLDGDLLLSTLVRRAVPHMASRHVEEAVMHRKMHPAGEIVDKLRQVDFLVSQGRKVAEAIRSIKVTEVVAG